MTEIEGLYARYFKDVYLFSYSLTKDQHLAEDITSETFIKAVQAIQQFNGDSDIRVWLFQIAKYTYFSYLRKNKKMVPVETLEEEADGLDLEQTVITKEESNRVQRILEALSEPYKEVFILRIYGALSFKQIAAVFGKTDNWAAVTFHRAKNKIRQEMEDLT